MPILQPVALTGDRLFCSYLTENQIAAKKDPILFGVIANSHKLYFVADWKDETDDLDMAEVNRVLGRQPDVIAADPTLAA